MKNRTIIDIPDKFACRQPIVLFDEDCALCSKSVQFLLRHNHSGNLSFASLQSDSGIEVLSLARMSYSKFDTLLLMQDNRVFSYSTAALKISAHVGFPWRLLGIFVIVPPKVRDAVYKIIARNRFKWFGKKSICLIDMKINKQRFLS